VTHIGYSQYCIYVKSFLKTTQNTEHHLLILRSGIEIVCTRKVDNSYRMIFPFEFTDLFIDGNTGIVSNLLIKAGKVIKNRGFTNVRNTRQGDKLMLYIFIHYQAAVVATFTRISFASAFRRAIMVLSSLKASGAAEGAEISN